MDSIKALLHDSTAIIKKSQVEKGNKNNDYAYEFYCTEDMELAKKDLLESEPVNL